MIPKDALNNIATISEILVEVSKSHIMSNKAIDEIRELNIAEIYFTLRQAFNDLESLKKPPTADDVCEALSEYLRTVYGKVIIYYENKNFGMEIQHSVDDVTSHELVSLLIDNIIYIGENLPSHLITLIGRFYEGLEK